MRPTDIISLLDQPIEPIETAILKFEGRPGVYALLDDDENILYVGQSGNFGQRLRRHRADKKKRDVTCCCLVDVPGADERLIQETIWIALLRPPLNSAIMLKVHKGRLTEIRYRRRQKR